MALHNRLYIPQVKVHRDRSSQQFHTVSWGVFIVNQPDCGRLIFYKKKGAFYSGYVMGQIAGIFLPYSALPCNHALHELIILHG